MELVFLAQEALQSVAEYTASYRLGQTVLRHLDRSLWVVEKCARWAVPPPLDQDDRPQPELVRPLPWVFFLSMLVVLRVTRESISLLYLAMGRPPLRSADVVMYIQSKRRYLRTLKYQGNRMMRARTGGTSQPRTWGSTLQGLLDLTCCRQGRYGNNNTRLANNHEVMVVKRSKRGRAAPAPVADTMERLIERLMVDDESEDDSSYTLTNAASIKSDRSELTADSDQETVFHNDSMPALTSDASWSDEAHFPDNNITSSTPEKSKNNLENTNNKSPSPHAQSDGNSTEISNNNTTPHPNFDGSSTESSEQSGSSKDDSRIFLETTPPRTRKAPKHEKKLANGRTVNSAPSKMKGQRNRRDSDDVPVVKIAPGNKTL